MCPGEQRCPHLRSSGKGACLFGARNHRALVCCSRSEEGPGSHRLPRPRPPLAGPAQTLGFSHGCSASLRLTASLTPVQFPCFSARSQPPFLSSLLTRQRGDGPKRRAPGGQPPSHSLDRREGESSPFCPCPAAGSSSCPPGRWGSSGVAWKRLRTASPEFVRKWGVFLGMEKTSVWESYPHMSSFSPKPF